MRGAAVADRRRRPAWRPARETSGERPAGRLRHCAERRIRSFPMLSPAEQSNTSLIYGDRLMLKLFRRQQAGINPESEIGKVLTEKAHFNGVPPYAGSIEYEVRGGGCWTFAVLQGLVANEGDGWTLTLEELERYYETCAAVPFPERLEESDTQFAREFVGMALDSAAQLGKRTAALHLALASLSEDPAFSPEPLTAEDLQKLLGRSPAASDPRVRHAPGQHGPAAGRYRRPGRPGVGAPEADYRKLRVFRRATACRPNGFESTATIISARCCGFGAITSLWISKASRPARWRSAARSNPR